MAAVKVCGRSLRHSPLPGLVQPKVTPRAAPSATDGVVQVRVHSLDSFHYTLPGSPLNELNGSLLPLATPANSQLWPTNSGQLTLANWPELESS